MEERYKSRLPEINYQAFQNLCDARDYLKGGDLDDARVCYAKAWGYYSIQGHQGNMNLCDRMLGECGVEMSKLEDVHKIGRCIASEELGGEEGEVVLISGEASFVGDPSRN
jgi:hypothetical protein